MKDKIKPKKEFSKKIFNIVIALFVIVLFYSMALMWKTDNTEGLMYLIPSVGTLASVTVGFYYWKAKMENLIKLSKEHDMSIEEVKELEEKINDFNVNSESEVY